VGKSALRSGRACFCGWGCVAGALEDVEYRDQLAAAGFEQIDIEPMRIYRRRMLANFFTPKVSTWMRLVRKSTANS